MRKETREFVRERSGGTVDYLNRQAKKLRDASEGIADKAKELMSHCCGSVDATTEGEKQSRQQERRET